MKTPKDRNIGSSGLSLAENSTGQSVDHTGRRIYADRVNAAALAERSLLALDWPFVAAALAGHARTSAGRRAAEGLVLESDTAQIARCFDATDEVQALREKRVGSPPVGGIEEIDQELDRTARGDVLGVDGVSAVAATLDAMSELQEFLACHGAQAPTLACLGAAIDLDRALVETFAAALDEHGELSEATYPVLAELRRRIAALDRSMRSMLEALLDSPEYADVLQDRYVTVRGDRFVLPVKAQAKGLGLGIVHDASRTEKTVFVEPASVVPVGNQRRMAEAALRDEERRILGELSALLGRHAAPLRDALRAAASLDVACARADFAAALAAVRPVVGEEGVVDLRAARHPILALSMPGVVPNDLHLDARHPVLVLTGPNAGGKTVAMKTIGLCALLVRAGCFVPAAAGSRLDLFVPVLADIGDMQTVHDGLSSFSAHLTTLRAMLEAAGPGSLLMLDEIAAGTDPTQGGALARAVVERLADVGARVVATTHFTQVKAMASVDSRVEVAALEYSAGRPTYHVVPGAVGESHALAAAERIGLDARLIERARELMEESERAMHDALANLDQERARAAEATRRAEELERSLAARETSVEAREREIAGRAREIEKRTAAAVVDKLRGAEEEVRRALAALREENSRERAEKARSAIAGAKREAVNIQREAAPPQREPRIGDRVRLLRVGLVGEIVGSKVGELEIRAGAMTVRAKHAEVEIVQDKSPSTDTVRGPKGAGKNNAATRGASSPGRREEPAAEGNWLESALRTDTNTLDLRGLRVEEGLERLQAFLDDAMLGNREIVFVLHGHGTGAMKSAIRRSLAASPYVNASAPAPEDQGGDALTVSRLRG